MRSECRAVTTREGFNLNNTVHIIDTLNDDHTVGNITRMLPSSSLTYAWIYKNDSLLFPNLRTEAKDFSSSLCLQTWSASTNGYRGSFPGG